MILLLNTKQITMALTCITIYLSINIYLFIHCYLHLGTCSLISERGERKEKERETSMWARNTNQLPLAQALIRDQTCNPGTCPDWELNLWHFDLQDNAPTNWATLIKEHNSLFWLIFLLDRNYHWIYFLNDNVHGHFNV